MVDGTARLPGAQLIAGGGRSSLDAMLQVANASTTQLDVDVFSGKSQWFDAIAVERPGVDQLYLADPEVSKPVRQRAKRTGGAYVKVGAEPAKNHAKSVIANASDAIVSTAAFAPLTPTRYEVSVRFGGDAAAAAAELVRSRASGDAQRIVAAAEDARRFGIVLNDPQYGIWHLSEEVNGLVQGAERRLIIASKRVEEPGIIADIKTAKSQGVRVGGLQKRSDYPFHANIVIADDRAYIGSGHLTKRVLTGGGSNGRISRELGVIIDDPQMVDQLAASLRENKFVRLGSDGLPSRWPPAKSLGFGIAALAGVAGGAYLLFGRDD